MTVVTPPKAVVNPQAEALLDELEVPWALEEIETWRIDRPGSRANQARITPIDEELIERYGQAHDAGAVFPALIVGLNGRKRVNQDMIIADGNHRDEVYVRNGAKKIWAYVFKYTDEDEFHAVAYTANARLNGAANTLEERLLHASHFVNSGTEIKDAAIQFGVTKGQISVFRNAMKARERFIELGIHARTYSDLSDSALVTISGAATDGALAAALRAAKTVNVKDVSRALRDASKTARSEREKTHAQLQSLEQLAEAQAKSTAKRLVSNRRGGAGRDTIHMRLLSAIQVLEEIRDKQVKDKYDDELNRIFSLIMGLHDAEEDAG